MDEEFNVRRAVGRVEGDEGWGKGRPGGGGRGGKDRGKGVGS